MSAPPQKVKILLLEDVDEDADAIRDNLESYGWELERVRNVVEFEQKVRERVYDVFVIDYDIPADRGSSKAGGGEKSLEAAREIAGNTPAIVYSGVLESELQEAQVIEDGAAYILKKGGKGSNLAALIRKISSEHNEMVAQKLKSYFAGVTGEKSLYLRLVSEESVQESGEIRKHIRIEVQRLFDEKPMTYNVILDSTGEVVAATEAS
ncbi:MAG: response regulator [Nitrososphaerales archaeon]